MIIKLQLVIIFIYASFAFDSLLKVDVGIQVHLGVLMILLYNMFSFFGGIDRALTALRFNLFFTIFFIYFLIMTIFPGHIGGWAVFVYFIVAINVLLYCHLTLHMLPRVAFIYFQWILVLTGFMQYLSLKLFGIQISFIDALHYDKGYSVSERMRGFFVEPNWFAISLTFNSLLLFGNNLIDFASKNKYLFALTFLAFILNGTIATLFVLVLVYLFPYFRQGVARGLLYLLLALISFLILFAFRSFIQSVDGIELGDALSFLNSNSRLLPIERVFEFQFNGELFYLLFGNGVGSWSNIAVPNGLSALVHEVIFAGRDASEFPVFFFELGIFGILILFIDFFYLCFKANIDNYNLIGAFFLFIVCIFLYPTFKFWMYMPFYFYARAYVTRQHSYLNRS